MLRESSKVLSLLFIIDFVVEIASDVNLSSIVWSLGYSSYNLSNLLLGHVCNLSNNNSLNVYGKSNFNSDVVVSGNTSISGNVSVSSLTVGSSTDSSSLNTTAMVYGTLEVNCINLIV